MAKIKINGIYSNTLIIVWYAATNNAEKKTERKCNCRSQ